MRLGAAPLALARIGREAPGRVGVDHPVVPGPGRAAHVRLLRARRAAAPRGRALGPYAAPPDVSQSSAGRQWVPGGASRRAAPGSGTKGVPAPEADHAAKRPAEAAQLAPRRPGRRRSRPDRAAPRDRPLAARRAAARRRPGHARLLPARLPDLARCRDGRRRVGRDRQHRPRGHGRLHGGARRPPQPVPQPRPSRGLGGADAGRPARGCLRHQPARPASCSSPTSRPCSAKSASSPPATLCTRRKPGCAA